MNGNADKDRQYTQKVGILSSILEYVIPEQMFPSTDSNNPEPDAISVVKAIQNTSAAGQRIYRITRDNMASVLPNIHHDADTMSEITTALNVGKLVFTHTVAVSMPEWSGAGYILVDTIIEN